MKNLDTYENQLSVGQVKTISTGNIVNYVELLFSPTTKAQFYFDADKMQLTISDTDIRIPEVSCELDKETLRNLILGLQKMYNQLEA